MCKCKILLVLIFLLAMTVSGTKALAAGEENQQLFNDAKSSLAEFKKQSVMKPAPDSSTALLTKLSNDLGQIDFSKAASASLKPEAVKLMLFALDAIDKAKDPNFNITDVPSMNLAPPVINGSQLPAGVAAEEIKDPAARKVYETALAANKAKAQKFTFETTLSSLQARLDFQLRNFYLTYYGNTDEEKSSFNRIIAQAQISAVTKTHIKAVLEDNITP